MDSTKDGATPVTSAGDVLLKLLEPRHNLEGFEIAALLHAIEHRREPEKPNPLLTAPYENSKLIRYPHWDEVSMRIAKSIRQGILYPETENDKKAREIMGASFYGPQEISLRRSRVFSKYELNFLGQMPFSSEELAAHTQSHLLFAINHSDDLPVLVEQNEKRFAPGHAEKLLAIFRNVSRHMGSGWVLLRKNPVPKSARKPFNSQKNLLGPDERVPDLRLILYAMFMTGRKLFKDGLVRTSTGHNGNALAIGTPTPAGIEIRELWDDKPYPDVWIASEVNIKNSSTHC